MGRRRRVAVARAVDKISSLPDAILSGILSLIPTKEAVATSILSKRWIHLWKSVDNINLSKVKVNDAVSSYKFNEFMYSVLVSHVTAGSNFINSFDLNITYDETALASSTFHNITKWIDLVVQRRLKHLSLQIHMCDIGCPDVEEVDFKLPISIFTCKTLVRLDLCSFRVEGFCFSSIGFGFPSLKTLHLIDIHFHQDRDFMLLLAGCPNLEDLLASFIDIQDSGTNSPAIHQEFKTLSLPKLTRAVIITDDEREFYFPVNALSNSEYLRIYTLKLYTQGLQFYEMDKPQHPYDDIPIFHNLTHLELFDNWYLVARVLQHFPKLQHLKLVEDSGEEIENQENWVDLESVPECLLSSLRTCTLRGFSGLQSELGLAKYILENAKYLQTMIIWCESKQSKIQRKLSACVKASATCQLSVHIDDNM